MTVVAGKNRRVWPRRKPRSTAKVECRRGTLGLGPNLADAVLDISEGGIQLIIKTPLERQEDVEIVIRGYCPRDAVKRTGTVCWCVPLQDGRFCVGVSFEKWISFADIQQVSKP